MGQIQSSVGLLSGFPVQDTVDKLIQIASQPKNLLTNRTKLLQSEQAADNQLSSLLLAFQFEAKQLGSASLFQSKQVSSSNTAALTAAVSTDGNPAAGNYQFTPIQTASAQQFFSQDFGATEAVGAGSLTFQVGGFVDQGIALDELNSGTGVQRGKIRITDRNGDNAVIDLSFARTVDDVLKAISDNTDINVTATASGDKIKLTDNTSGTGNLTVKETAGGTTAADLGLAGIDTSLASATGTDIFSLGTRTKLASLNDGTGVQIVSGANELSVSLADGSTLAVDLDGSNTLGDVLSKINAAAPAKLSAAIGSDGNRLELTDLTTGSGTFAVSNSGDSTAADDLGLTTTAAGDTVTGRRLVSGLRDTLLSSLKGGQGLGALGTINITNRNNVSSSVDLSGAETLGDVVTAINNHATGVTAAVNSARNGIVLTDTTGATSHNFVVANGDANSSATALNIAVSSAVTNVNSGALDRKLVSKATELTSLKDGFTIKDIIITDSAGHVGALDLNKTGHEAKTLGDIIDRINALSIGVEARINDNGDGIQLKDTAGGTGKLTVNDVGNGTTAKDLRILGTAKTVTINGTPTQVIDGTAHSTVTIDGDDTLADIVKKINDLKQGITASVLNDGGRQRLSLQVDKSGAANEVLVDASGTTLSLQQVSSARDAVLLYGSPGTAGGVLLSSATNDFKGVVDGLDLTIKDGTATPVTVAVSASNASLVNTVTQFVDAYNSIRDSLDKTTVFDAAALTTGILFGTSEALHADSDLANLLSSQFFGVGSFNSLSAIGLNLNDKGHLDFDKSKLDAAFANDPESLKKLFTDKTFGVATKFDATVERLAGKDHSLLSGRIDSLTTTIKDNNDRISTLQDQLDRQRDVLTTQFQQIDTIVANYQRNLAALQSLQILSPLGTSSSSSSSASPLNLSSIG